MTVRRAPAGLAVPAVLVALAVNVPLVYIFLRSGQNGWSAFAGHVTSPLIGKLLVRTLLLGAGTVALSVALAVPYAWLVMRTDLPGRRFWGVLGALPLVFPSYVAAFSLVSFLGPGGYVSGEALGELAYGYTGALLSLAVFSYPYTYLLLVAALKDLDPALEESSVSLGASRWRTFGSVVLPQLRGPLYAGSLLVLLYTLSDFGAVSIVRYNTFTLSIYNAYRSLFDRTVAASMASVLVVLTLVVILVELGLSRRLRPSRQRPARPPSRLPLGWLKVPALAFTGGVSLLGVGIPLAMVAVWAGRAVLGSGRAGEGMGALWGRLWEQSGAAALGSLGVSTAAALVAVATAVPIAAWVVRHRSRAAVWVDRAAHSGYALPGLVIALSLVFFVSRYLRPLYQTLAVLVAAYVIRFLPQALGAVRSSLQAVAPAFEEAARSLGRGTASVLTTLTLPLIRPGLAAGFGLVFLTAMKELPATLLLRPTGFETLAVRVWTGAAEGIYSEAALPALMLVVASAPPVYWLLIRPVLEERS